MSTQNIEAQQSVLVQFILDHGKRPLYVLGAAIAYAQEMGDPVVKQLADAADRGIQQELEAMKKNTPLSDLAIRGGV